MVNTKIEVGDVVETIFGTNGKAIEEVVEVSPDEKVVFMLSGIKRAQYGVPRERVSRHWKPAKKAAPRKPLVRRRQRDRLVITETKFTILQTRAHRRPTLAAYCSVVVSDQLELKGFEISETDKGIVVAFPAGVGLLTPNSKAWIAWSSRIVEDYLKLTTTKGGR